MPEGPTPLIAGELMGERFRVESVLGSGGFGIVYLATDTGRNDHVAVKELAPANGRRDNAGNINVDPTLRKRFFAEAKAMASLNVAGVPPVRAVWAERGTAYFACEYYEDSQTLSDLTVSQGRLPADQAMGLFLDLLHIVEDIHGRGWLHRDIKPSNVVVTAHGHVRLIDFGAAREWTDGTMTAIFTAGYTPPEQMSERARRGPASDIYALCATGFHMLAGTPPPDSAQRINGVPLPDLLSLRPDIDPAFASAIGRGLSLPYAERPASARDLRELITQPEGVTDPTSLEHVDEGLVRLQRFAYDRRACPACGGLLARARPLGAQNCPVCRLGSLRPRRILTGQCPVCNLGILRLRDQNHRPVACPVCHRGVFGYRRRGIRRVGVCSVCQTQCIPEGKRFRIADRRLTAAEWVHESGRSHLLRVCEDCHAQFDHLPDDRWRQAVPEATGRYRALYADEWDRVASGLEPSCGNAECTSCGADYFVEGHRITLLDSPEDPFGFAEGYLGRRLTRMDARWLGAGKESSNEGVTCDSCPTEFDTAGSDYRLVRTPNRRMARFVDTVRSLEDWHRLAQGVPSCDQAEAYRDSMEGLLRAAYRRGEIGFDAENAHSWVGPAEGRLGVRGRGTLTVDEHGLSFQHLLKRDRWPLAGLDRWTAEQDQLRFESDDQTIRLAILPTELRVRLKSGEQRIPVDVDDLVARLNVLAVP